MDAVAAALKHLTVTVRRLQQGHFAVRRTSLMSIEETTKRRENLVEQERRAVVAVKQGLILVLSGPGLKMTA